MSRVEEITILQGTTWQKGWLVRYTPDITTTPLAYIDDTWSARCQIRNEKHGSTLLATLTASVTATGLTFTARGSVTATGHCAAYAWSSPIDGDVTISCSASSSNSDWGAVAVAYSAVSGIGAQVTSDTSQSVSLTTTGDDSSILLIVADWDVHDWGATRPWLTGSGTPVELAYQQVPGHYTVGVVRYDNLGVAGAKSVGLSGLTGTWSVVAVELLA